VMTFLQKVDTVDFGTIDNEPDLEFLKGLPQLYELNFENGNVSDKGLSYIKELNQLQMLNLRGTHITDAGLEHLKGLSQLQCLDLDRTQATDVGLDYLRAYPKSPLSLRERARVRA
jgi:hypothetical protein